MRSNAIIEQALAQNASEILLPVSNNEPSNSTTPSSHGPNISQDIGIGLGGLAVIGLLGACLWQRCRRKKQSQDGLLDAEMGEVITDNERLALRVRAEFERNEWARRNM